MIDDVDDGVRFTVRVVVLAILAIGIAVFLWVVVDRLFLAPDRAETKINDAKVDSAVAGAAAANAVGAIDAGQAKVERETRIERITRENTVRIMSAPGAQEPYGPDLDREFMAALCLRREATRLDPACAAVPRPGEEHLGETDAIGADSAGSH